jgi:predicted dinucleotide-binding enzyme
MIASRNDDKRQELEDTIQNGIKTGDFVETAEFGDIVVISVKGDAAVDVVVQCGIANLAGKTVIDTNNPIAPVAPDNGVLAYFTEQNSSLMEELQDKAPDAHFVKAFSCVGSAHMIDPDFESRPSMFICGNNDDAKAEVKEILARFGWDTEDMGGVEAARAIEPLAMLWCIPLFKGSKGDYAFKMLHK